MIPHTVCNGVQHDTHTAYTHETCLFVDLAEAFAGRARITQQAKTRGLKAFAPADILYGWDLSSAKGAAEWKHMIMTEKPLVVIIGSCCTN